MKFLFIITILFISCNTSSLKPDNLNKDDFKNSDSQNHVSPNQQINSAIITDSVYSNNAFRNVAIIKTGNGFFEINGEARVFEATFYYFLMQNNIESDEEFVTASIGAPEWGKFNFSINSNIYKNNIPLYLVLFEASAKDGSRVNELTIRLF